MFENCKGKKLLIIGVEENDSIVRAAQEMGVYVVLIDRNADAFDTEGKHLADEIWKMDYSDIDSVVKKCQEENIDGLMTGYSEFKVLFAAKISEKLGKPFYATVDQVELTRNKRKFKDECIKYGVPLAKDYCFAKPLTQEEKEQVNYPVIVKPTDYAGKKGVSVCYNEEELNEAITYALEYSQSKTIICEDFIEGTEIMAIYTLVDGEASLSCLNEKYLAQTDGRKTSLCHAAVSPSKYYNMFVETIDDKIKAFLKGIKAENGVAFFQAIANHKGITVFEMGYRLNGNNDCNVLEKYNNINYMKMMISHSVTGHMGDDLKKDNPLGGKNRCSLYFYMNEGEVGKVDCSLLADVDGIDDVHIYALEGRHITDEDNSQRRGVAVKLSADNLEALAEKIDEVQQKVIILNDKGENMLFEPFDTNRLFEK